MILAPQCWRLNDNLLVLLLIFNHILNSLVRLFLVFVSYYSFMCTVCVYVFICNGFVLNMNSSLTSFYRCFLIV